MQQSQNDWKAKMQEIFQTCQEEIVRTTEIGKKMLSASKTNTNLHEMYEELGQLAYSAMERGDLDWNHPRVNDLRNHIKNAEQDLSSIQKEVNDIRFKDKKDKTNSDD